MGAPRHVSGRSQWVWQAGTRVDRGCSVLKASEDRTICRGTGPGAGSKSACLLLTSYEAVTRSLISAVHKTIVRVLSLLSRALQYITFVQAN